jgi:hypothetical protein
MLSTVGQEGLPVRLPPGTLSRRDGLMRHMLSRDVFRFYLAVEAAQRSASKEATTRCTDRATRFKLQNQTMMES